MTSAAKAARCGRPGAHRELGVAYPAVEGVAGPHVVPVRRLRRQLLHERPPQQLPPALRACGRRTASRSLTSSRFARMRVVEPAFTFDEGALRHEAACPLQHSEAAATACRGRHAVSSRSAFGRVGTQHVLATHRLTGSCTRDSSASRASAAQASTAMMRPGPVACDDEHGNAQLAHFCSGAYQPGWGEAGGGVLRIPRSAATNRTRPHGHLAGHQLIACASNSCIIVRSKR